VSHIQNREEQNSVNDDQETEEREQIVLAEDGFGRFYDAVGEHAVSVEDGLGQ